MNSVVLNSLLAEKIGNLRIKSGMTQTDLANKLGISRNAVNCWEMSLSNPSLANIVALSHIFNVSVDYLLSNDDREMVDISDLSFEEKEVVYKLIACLKAKK